MSDIIIEGKNLDDITQSNFQTVGVRSSIHFVTDYIPNQGIDIDAHPFKYDTLENHLARLGENFPQYWLPKKVLKFLTVEPWQGRLHYDKDYVESLSDGEGFGLGSTTSEMSFWQPKINEGQIQMRVPTGLSSPAFNALYYPYFYTSYMINPNYGSDAGIISYRIDNFYNRMGNRFGFGTEERESNVLITKDDRFPLGTYTEEDKQYWELQTSDPISRESQFAQSRMKVAQTTKIILDEEENIGILSSEEEQFSVDAFTFTERDGVITPLFFYYDKELHPVEYNNATTGKVSMKIELRASGRNGKNELDLYQERLPIRPFLLGFEKDEQMGPIGYPGTGTVNGEGLYYINQVITLRAVADDNSYLLGIYDIPDNNLKSTGGSSGTYTFAMPPIDNQYIAKFRPNPQIEIRSRWIDKEGNPFIGDSSPGAGDAKGTYRVFPSNVVSLPDPDNLEQDDEGNYLNLLPTMVPDADFYPEFLPAGTTLVKNTFRPTPQGGSEFYTVEALELTDNYKFKGFTYQSASAEILPLEKLSDDNVDVFGATPPTTLENYYMGGDDEQADIDVYSDPVDPTFIRTFKLQQDFRYLDGKLKIYANFELIRFSIDNLNNNVDFENNFADALKYGPFKFASVLNSDGSYPDSNNYSFEDITSYPAYETNQNDIVRLLISGVNMAYANADYLPDGTQGHLSPLEETGYDFGNFFIEKNYTSTFPSETEPTSPSETEPQYPPTGWTPGNMMVGTLSPLEQWQWDGTQWGIVIGTLSSEEQWQWDGTQWTPIMIKNDQLVIENPIAINHVLELPAPQTLAYAIELAGEDPSPQAVTGEAPAFVGGTTFYDTQPSGYSVGNIGGPNGEFKIIDINYIGQEIDLHSYELVWGPNISGATVNANYYRLADNEIGYYRGIRLLGRTEGTEWDAAGSAPDLIENRLVTDNLINSIISTETTSSISYQPLQRGVFVKPILVGNVVQTTFELTSVGPDEIVRPIENNGAIDANMFGFEEEVRFQVTPSIPAEEPTYQVWVWDDEDSTLKNISDGDINLTKEQFGVTFEWNEGGNFGTLNYNVPESRDAAIFDGNRPIWFKYVEFRFEVMEAADYEGNEQSDDGSAPNWFVFTEYIYNNSAGYVTGPSGVVSAIDYENFSDSDASDRTFTVTAEPNPGYEIEMWEILSGEATIIGSIFGSNVLIRADGPGIIRIKANWQEGGGPS